MNNNILTTCGNSGIRSAFVDVLAKSNQIYSRTRIGNVDASLENVEYLWMDMLQQ